MSTALNELYLDSSCLYDSPVSVFAGVELWSGEVSVDEGKRGGIIGISPFHSNQVAGKDCKTSLPHLHYRIGVRLGIVPGRHGRAHEDLKREKDCKTKP